jgi:AbrB family looped-hinge helix DNA binding protein
MSSTSKESVKRKVFPKGQIVIPVSLRRKYYIDIGDHVDVIAKPDGVLLRPLPKKEEKKSMTDSLFGMFSKYAKGKPKLKKADITKATKEGFVEGWEKRKKSDSFLFRCHRGFISRCQWLVRRPFLPRSFLQDLLFQKKDHGSKRTYQGL